MSKQLRLDEMRCLEDIVEHAVHCDEALISSNDVNTARELLDALRRANTVVIE